MNSNQQLNQIVPEEAYLEEAEEEVLLEGAPSDIILNSFPENRPFTDIQQNADEPNTPQNATSRVWKYYKFTKRNGIQKCLCSLCLKEGL